MSCGRQARLRAPRFVGQVATVQGWRFKPAERNTKPVPVYMTIEVDFHLY